MTRAQGFMDMSLIKKVVKEVSEHHEEGFRHIALHQMGEPLLHPHIIDIVKLICDSGLLVTLTTSGFNLNSTLSLQLLQTNLTSIAISLDSIDPQQYSKIRCGSNLDIVLNNIDKLIFLKSQEPNSKTVIDLVTIEMAATVGQAEAIEQRFGDRVRAVGGNIVVKKFAQWGGTFTTLASEEQTEEAQPCSQMEISEIVQWDGSVVPCCLDYDGKLVLGNAYSETLESIWSGEKYTLLRNRIRAGDKTIPLCGACHHLWKPEVGEQSVSA
jgi:MoaA/NifB/PqqE/SkfB family radical SAM enzyme